jgi:diphthamide synthase (EF-2-diphthine--ammonia ligase)
MEPHGLTIYDRIIVACAGGKDSVAALFYLLDCSVPVDRLKLWHHDVDEQELAFMFQSSHAVPSLTSDT